jgi:AraC-like DNA-binding protein
MSEYSYVDYEANEALHLSDSEKCIVERTVENIQMEYSANIDSYSKDLIVSNLELLLNYANRFYGRQFITRTTANKKIVEQFNTLLTEQCSLDTLHHMGQPSVKELAGAMGYSPNYLSDMLKKETGKTTQEHIKLRVMELAETMLRTTNEPIYLVAEKLGFEAPSSFTKFIKAQYGVTPLDLRKQHTRN